MTEIACDSSSLISLGNNCTLNLIPFFSDNHDVDFYISKAVKQEIVDRPTQTKKFKFTGLKMNQLIQEGYLKVIDEPVKEYTNRFLELSNSLLSSKETGENIEILHRGEAEAIGTLKYLGTNNLLIDERTTRLLIEDIHVLKDYISSRVKEEIEIEKDVKEKIDIETNDIDVIRSSELIARGYETGFFKEKTKDMLEGSLYGVKFAGCAIKSEEIKEYLKLIG